MIYMFAHLVKIVTLKRYLLIVNTVEVEELLVILHLLIFLGFDCFFLKDNCFNLTFIRI